MIVEINKKEFWLNGSKNTLVKTKDGGFKCMLREPHTNHDFMLFVSNVRLTDWSDKPFDKHDRDADSNECRFDLHFERCAIADTDEWFDNSGTIPLVLWTKWLPSDGKKPVDSTQGRWTVQDKDCQHIQLDNVFSGRLSCLKGIWCPDTMIAIFKMIKKNKQAIIDAVDIALDLDMGIVGLRHKQIK